MIQVIEENKRPSTSRMFAQAFSNLGQSAGKGIPQYLQGKQAQEDKRKREAQLSRLTGIEGPEEFQLAAFKEMMKSQGKEDLWNKKIASLNQMRDQSSFQDRLQQHPEDEFDSYQKQELPSFGEMGQERPIKATKKAQISETGERSGRNKPPFSQKEIDAASLIDPSLGRSRQAQNDEWHREKRHQQDIQARQDLQTRKEEAEIAKPLFNEMNLVRKNIPLQEQAIDDIVNASPDVGALDYFADVTGFEPLRSAAGAKLKTGIKDFFLSDLTRAGARPNQWIEQQLADALPKIGRSPEANLITAEGLKFKTDLAKKRVELFDQFVKEDQDKYGRAKGSTIDSRIYQAMKPYVIERQKQLKNNIENIKSETKINPQYVRMISPNGEVYDILPGDVDEALENEFSFSK